MTADSRKNRILKLIVDKVFESLDTAEEQELNALLDHPDEDRAEWEQLLESEKLIDYFVANFQDSQSFDKEAGKARIFQILNQDKKIEPDKDSQME